MKKIISVRFKASGKAYYFDPTGFDVKEGDYVVVETARLAGANPCPPMMLGVGIGGTFEQVALLAKEALAELREGPHPDPYYDALERELTERVNALGIGPQGFGGRTTALGVRIRTAPTHIAGLPVAVNVGCHVTRHASATI